MHNEWFYINQWRENNREVWVVLDRQTQSVVKPNLTRKEAEDYVDSLNKENNSNFVVNMKDSIYDKYCNNTEVEVESNNNRKQQ